ncbi:DUF2924 domain-containing protein [Methylobacterium durans]|uniref:DUF2924 domain-containing protein n=1 Tax=Methylobacterium durans TaxID=2202825 RepID=A0A2U8WEU1_9HYPH|nr:DUF2924 domain-containing protein [Methylobacterium durans]AWN44725.1 DUF2924 domain-containing protein [Methylobacterium durans]
MSSAAGSALAHAESDLDREIATLGALDLAALRSRWRQGLRSAPPPQLSRALLLRLLAYRLQAKALGDLDRDTARLLDRLARERLRRRAAEARGKRSKAAPPIPPAPSPGLKPGTLLAREHAGQMHTVTVLADGFAWQDRTYTSLSEVARAITGTRWNGPRFFGLRDKPAMSSGGGR